MVSVCVMLQVLLIKKLLGPLGPHNMDIWKNCPTFNLVYLLKNEGYITMICFI